MRSTIIPASDQDDVIQMLFIAIKELNQELSELRQYIGADFEVVNLRFDRLEDRIDRLDSSLTYEH